MILLDYLTTKQAAKMLGYTDTKTLSNYCLQGRIPDCVRIGRNWLIPKLWVENEIKNPTLAPQGGRGNARK